MTSRSRGPICYAEHGWLAMVVPDGAMRFRAADPDLVATLEQAGAELVETAPDVEIASPDLLTGDAATAVVSLGTPLLDGRLRAIRAGRRLYGSLRIAAEAHRARRVLRELGYTNPSVVTWDFSHRFGLNTWGDGESRSVVARLPQNALVVAGRSTPGPSVYDAAVAAASTSANVAPSFQTPTMGAGLLIAFSADHLLRAAVGAARRQVEGQVATFEVLQRSPLPAPVRSRLPSLVSSGKHGLADWSVEERLPGRKPEQPLTERVLADCLDFLVDLHVASGSTGGPRGRVAEDAEVIAAVCGPEDAAAVRALGRHLDTELASMPRSFGHGDFHSGNLLVEGERLVGVVDWDAAGPGRLAFLDLLQLRISSSRAFPGQEWGPTLVRRLVPWVRAGGDELARAYWRRIGFEPSQAQLEELVAAYWLDRAAYELGMYADRRRRQAWMRNNVSLVLQALARP